MSARASTGAPSTCSGAMGADVVHREHVRVVERSGRARLLLERTGIGRMRKKQLDRDVARETVVARPPHLARRARAEPLVDRVGADAIARLDAPAVAHD